MPGRCKYVSSSACPIRSAPGQARGAQASHSMLDHSGPTSLLMAAGASSSTTSACLEASCATRSSPLPLITNLVTRDSCASVSHVSRMVRRTARLAVWEKTPSTPSSLRASSGWDAQPRDSETASPPCPGRARLASATAAISCEAGTAPSA